MKHTKKWDVIYMIYILLIVLLPMFFLYGTTVNTDMARNQPYADEGVLDLGGLSLQDDGIVRLDGEWEFYGERLLEPEDFSNGDLGNGKTMMLLPQRRYGLKGEVSPGGENCATYRLMILLPDGDSRIAVRMPLIPVAARVWANGRLVFERGTVSDNKENIKPEQRPGEIYVDTTGNSLELIVQQADSLFQGAIEESLLLGTHEQISGIARNKIAFNVFFIGSLMVVGIYHMMLFMFRKREYSVFWFGLFLFVIGMYGFITGERIIRIVIPDISEQILVRSVYLLIYLSYIVLVMYIVNLFPKGISPKISRMLAAISILLVPIIAFLPLSVFSNANDVLKALAIVALAGIAFLAVRVVMSEKKLVYLLIGIVPFIACTSHDILMSYKASINHVMEYRLFPIGILFFIYTQTFVISGKYVRAYMKIDEMSAIISAKTKHNDEFIARMSGKVRKPMDSIIRTVESILDTEDSMLGEMGRLNLSVVLLSARRLKSIMNDVVDFTRIKDNNLKLDRKSVDVWQVAEYVIELNRTAIAGRSIEIINNVPQDLPVVWADEERLRQILNNLISNAVKYTQFGKIIIMAHEKKKIVTISIVDTGIGIPEDDIVDIFNYDDDAEKNRVKGSGFSLYITRKLVELHGGEISVESEINKGTSFIFTLPTSDERTMVKGEYGRWASRASLKSVKNIIGRIRSSISSEGEYRIIVADADIETLQLIASYVKGHDYGINVAVSANEVLQLLMDNGGSMYDMLILGTELVTKNGFEMCRTIRNRFTMLEMPILLLSSDKNPETVSAAFNSGANDYLAKPFNRNEMLAKMKTLLALKHSAEQSVMNARKLESERNHRLLVETLGELARVLASTLELPEVLNRLMSSLKHFVNIDFGLILLKSGDKYVLSSIIDSDGYKEMGEHEVEVSKSSLLSLAETSMKPIPVKESGRIFNDMVLKQWLPYGLKSSIVTPIVNVAEVLGIIVLCSYEINEFSSDKVEIAFDFATQSGIAIKNARLFSAVQKLAVTDGLTGLNNRRRFFELAEKEFERYKRYDTGISVMMFDIDDFKQLNDSYGHQVGDEVLKEIAARCKDVLRENDIAGRYGGEEFVVLLVETGEREAAVVAERLRESIASSPISVSGFSKMSVTISIGVSTVDDLTKTLEELVNNADKALYRAKKGGKNCVVSFKRSLPVD